ncbi:hypothetical protein [Streptomyces sp. NPDC002853]
MTSVHSTAERGSRVGAAFTALIPLVAGSGAAIALRRAGAGEVADAAGAVTTTLVGLLFFQQSTRHDGERACASAAGLTDAAATTGRRINVVPSSTTVALSVVLATAAFWLTYLLTTWMGIGSLGYLNGEIPDDPSAVARRVALRASPVFIPVVFLIAVAVGHRLRARAVMALTAAVTFFTTAVLVFHQLLLRHWESVAPWQVVRTPEDFYVPVVCGVLSWIVCRLGLWFAARTQGRYDAMQEARLRAPAPSRTSRARVQG